MPTPRLMPVNVLLSDGTILYLNGATWGQAGGNSGQVQYAYPPIFSIDLFDPRTNRWTSLANMTIPRLYHSGALLLPSGHVITTGSEMQNYEDFWPVPNEACWPAREDAACKDPFERRIERFAPPYLQTGWERPLMGQVTYRVTYGSLFKINMVSDALKIDTLNAIPYSTTTHGINTDQRQVELEIMAKTDTALYVRAPRSGGIAPPGHWMLFALERGVPGVAKTVLFTNGEKSEVEVPKGA
ncbi:hypothetical protein HK104_008358, partial [Borealophlyctis nickersoniae]